MRRSERITAGGKARETARGLLRILHPATDGMRRAMVVRPGDSALPFPGVAVENCKPSSGIALRLNLGQVHELRNDSARN